MTNKPMRPCKKCGKPFNTHACKICQAERGKKHYRDNKEIALARSKKQKRSNRARDNVHDNPKNHDDIKRWASENKERVNFKAGISRKILKGEIVKPKRCPKCNEPTPNHKMYMVVTKGLVFKGFRCSFCDGEALIKKNDGVK